MQKLLTKRAVGEALQRHPESVMRWVREGRFPAPIKINGHGVRWREQDVAAWIEAQPAKA